MPQANIDEHGRPEPPPADDEISTLTGFLDYQRATLEWKCRGLNDEQLRIALPPSTMTLGSILKHLAWVEDYWFTLNVGERRPPELWTAVDWDADPDWDWRSAATDSADDLRALWTESTARSRAVVQAEIENGATQGLARTHPAWGSQEEVSLRWVLVHMIEEYARHNGHADLIRESIDGETGE